MKLKKECVFVNEELTNKKDIINFIGKKFVEFNATEPEYIKSMHTRDEKSSVAIGNYLAIPHCLDEDRKYIKNDCVVFVKLKNSVFWDEQEILFVVGLAISGNNQIDTLSKLALCFSNHDDVLNFYKNANTFEDIKKWIEEESI